MYSTRLRLPAWLALLLVVHPLCGGELSTPKAGAKPPDRFLRLTRGQDHAPLALETAIVRCAPANAARRLPIVDLVAAVHIADKSYYERLNREFEKYDVVLYELVAPDEFKLPQQGGGGNDHPITILQNGMKDILGLEFQLHGIDYTRKNLTHADMSPDQFAESMRSAARAQ